MKKKQSQKIQSIHKMQEQMQIMDEESQTSDKATEAEVQPLVDFPVSFEPLEASVQHTDLDKITEKAEEIPPLILASQKHTSHRAAPRSKEERKRATKNRSLHSPRRAKDPTYPLDRFLENTSSRRRKRRKEEEIELSFAKKAKRLAQSKANQEESASQEEQRQYQASQAAKSAEVQHFATNRSLSIRHPRYAKIMRFVVAPLFLLLAIICFVFSLLNATVWRPAAVVSAQTTASTRYIATEPGVLPLVNNTVDIHVDSSKPVCLAVGTNNDIAGWLGSTSYTHIEGLSSWSQLHSVVAQGDVLSSGSQQNSQVNFQDSDLWITMKCGIDLALQWKADNNQALIIDTMPFEKTQQSTTTNTSQVNPTTVILTWHRTQVSNQARPVLMIGILLLLCAFFCATVLSMPAHHRRKSRKRRLSEQKARAKKRKQQGIDEEKPAPGIGADAPRWANDHVSLRRRVESRRRHANPTAADQGLARVVSSITKPHIATSQVRPIGAENAEDDDVQSTQVLILGDLPKKKMTESDHEESDNESTQVIDLKALQEKLAADEKKNANQTPEESEKAALKSDALKRLKPILKGSKTTVQELAAGTAFSVTSSAESEPDTASSTNGPAIVDIRGVNMVARTQKASSILAPEKPEQTPDPLQQPTVHGQPSSEEVADYLQRLSQELEQVKEADAPQNHQVQRIDGERLQVNKFAKTGNHAIDDESKETTKHNE